MVRHDSRKQGLVGQAAATLELIDNGYEVFLPFDGSCSFDLIAYKNKKFNRVSVKSSSNRLKSGSWAVELRQCGRDRKKKPFNQSTSDILAVHIPLEKRVVFFWTQNVKNKRGLYIKPI